MNYLFFTKHSQWLLAIFGLFLCGCLDGKAAVEIAQYSPDKRLEGVWEHSSSLTYFHVQIRKDGHLHVSTVGGNTKSGTLTVESVFCSILPFQAKDRAILAVHPKEDISSPLDWIYITYSLDDKTSLLNLYFLNFSKNDGEDRFIEALISGGDIPDDTVKILAEGEKGTAFWTLKKTDFTSLPKTPRQEHLLAIRLLEAEEKLKNLEAEKKAAAKQAAASVVVKIPVPVPDPGLTDDQLNEAGESFYDDKEGKQDYEKAFSFFSRAAEMGHAKAQYNLGRCFDKGRGVSKNFYKAVECYQKSADQGDAYGQNALGVSYELGEGVIKDQAEAVSWYLKSAKQGNAYGQCNLGVCYENGNGVVKNLTEAVRLYELSADQGDANAQNNLGSCYEKGKGVPVNYRTASNLYLKSAQQGNAYGQHNIARLYFRDIGMPEKFPEAVRWLTLSAQQGDVDSMNSLGVCYNEGRGVKKNVSIAFHWYMKAAEAGDSFAQNNVGACFLDGIGTTRDINLAIEWLTKSAAQGNQIAKNNLNLIARNASLREHQNNRRLCHRCGGSGWYYLTAGGIRETCRICGGEGKL